MVKNDKGLLVVISGPSGVGKGTICKHLTKKHHDIFLSVSATTRQPRAGEENGVHYNFINEDEFRNLIKEDGLMEWAAFCDNYYGTPKLPVIENINSGRDVVLEIEMQGAMRVKSKYPDGVYIFILPPSLEVLKERLSGRGTESETVIRKRLDRAKEELKQCSKYNYYVINDDIEKATEKIEAIMTAEKLRSERNELISEEMEEL